MTKRGTIASGAGWISGPVFIVMLLGGLALTSTGVVIRTVYKSLEDTLPCLQKNKHRNRLS